jgi:hypothetical protein
MANRYHKPDWICPKYQFLVFGSKNKCKCGLIRCESKPGDWQCLLCHEMNFASRFACRKCRGQRPIQRTGDWNCNECHEINFTGRSTCQKNTKPRL